MFFFHTWLCMISLVDIPNMVSKEAPPTCGRGKVHFKGQKYHCSRAKYTAYTNYFEP